MSSTSSSSKSGTHLLPILLVSMVLLVAAFIILVATRAESAGVLGYGFIRDHDALAVTSIRCPR
jgi:hypothetical protein